MKSKSALDPGGMIPADKPTAPLVPHVGNVGWLTSLCGVESLTHVLQPEFFIQMETRTLAPACSVDGTLWVTNWAWLACGVVTAKAVLRADQLPAASRALTVIE